MDSNRCTTLRITHWTYNTHETNDCCIQSAMESLFLTLGTHHLDCTLSLALRSLSWCTVLVGHATSSCRLLCTILLEVRISLKSSLSTQSVCHTTESESESNVGPESKSESRVIHVLTPESNSESHKKRRTPYLWLYCCGLEINKPVATSKSLAC